MSSEIEVVDDLENKKEVEEEVLKDDIYTAAAYGDLEKLQRLVESEGCSLSKPDSLGYSALQWAALNNRAAAAHYIIQHGGDINATDLTGQTALHWSAVRGAIQVADLLLHEGAQIHAADVYGYQITHVAAQYGQTALLYHIVTKWNADPDTPDNDGRSPLHWAAYKGFADCIRLLLFLDAYRGRQDKEGCTPLHWAAIRGNLEACTVLVQAGKKEDLMATDNTGFTPAQLASDKNHQQVAFFLGNARRVLDKRWDGTSTLGRFSKLGLAPALLCVIILLLITYINAEEKEESVWASALSCLLYFVCDRGKIRRSRLKGLDIRILAMRHPRRHVLADCLSSLIVMTILSDAVGIAAPNLMSRTLTKHIATVLFFGFGLWSLWDAYNGDGESEELAEVEAELDADTKANGQTTKSSTDDDLKKKKRPFMTQFFSPIFLKAFSITFFGEWGDKSQLKNSYPRLFLLPLFCLP